MKNKMKKLMTVLASAALAFGLYAEDVDKDGASFEAGEGQVDYAVLIGDKYYETLAAALADAKDDDVLIFLKNVELDACVEIRKAITLSLGGYTISAPASGAFEVYSSLTVQDGDIATGRWGIRANPGASVTIATGAALFCTGSPSDAAGIIAGANATVSVLGAIVLKETEAAAIRGIRNDGTESGAQITIGLTAKIVSSGKGIYFPDKDGVLTISDFAEITADDNALEVKAGMVTIGKATIKTTKPIAEATSVKNAGGTSVHGYALAIVENKAYADNISIAIDEGAKIAGKVGILKDDEEAPDSTSIIVAEGALFTDREGAATLIDGSFQRMAEAADEADYYAVENIPPDPTDITITVRYGEGIGSVRINDGICNDGEAITLPAGAKSVRYELAGGLGIDDPVFYQSTGSAKPVRILAIGTLPVADGRTITFSAKDVSDPDVTDDDVKDKLLEAGIRPSTLDKFSGPGEMKALAIWMKGHQVAGGAINKSEFVLASVRLDVDLITDETVVAFESVDLTDTTAATFKVKVGDSDVSAKKAVLSMVRAATEVGFGDGAIFEPKAEYDGTKKTVKVDISGKDAAFLKVVIPTDQMIGR